MVNRVTTSLFLPEKPIRDYPRTRKQLRSASCALTMRTLLALFVTAASFALAFPSTTEYATNATDPTSEYRGTFSHNRLASAEVFLHFLFTNGNACATQTSSTNLARKVKSRNTFSSTMQKVNAKTSWIDDKANSTRHRVKSLVEATRELNLGKCYVNISNIEGVSNGFRAIMDAETCSTIGPTSKETLKRRTV